MAYLQNDNISIIDVRGILQHNSTDLGTLCTSGQINPWSKWKPVRSSLETMTEAGLKAANYGLTVTQIPTDTYVPSPYTYSKPTGGSASPYRLGDFRGYTSTAQPFLYISDLVWDTTKQTVDQIYFLPNFKYGSASYEGQGDTSGMQILPADISGGSGLDFNNCYIGLMFYTGGTQYTIFSNRKIGETSSGNACLLYPNSNTNFRNYLNNMAVNTSLNITPFISLTNNPGGMPKFNLPLGTYVNLTKTTNFAYTIQPIITVTFTSSFRGNLGTLPTYTTAPEAWGSLTRPATNSTNEIITTQFHMNVVNSTDSPVTFTATNLRLRVGSTENDAASVYQIDNITDNVTNVSSVIIPARNARQIRAYAQCPKAATLYAMPVGQRASLPVAVYNNGYLVPSSTEIRFIAKD